MAKRFNAKTLVVLLFLAIILYFVFGNKSSPVASKKSMYMATPKSAAPVRKMQEPGVVGMDVSDADMEYASADLSGSINLDMGCMMKAGTGLASSLMPRDVAPQEQYGQFAPDDILKGQNFLNPRQQVGWPETIGGTIRNGNQDLRADPPNPKDAYVWNNSTIVPDLMQRNLFCN
jgi:hypothetical protein